MVDLLVCITCEISILLLLLIFGSMYIDFYNLAEPAFELRYQSPFFWEGGTRQTCYDSLLQGVESGAVFQLVSGDAGSGKSTILRRLRANFGKELFIARVSGADLDDFYNEIIAAFGLAKEVGSKVEFVIELNQILKERVAEGKTALLIIDDAQELAQEIFAELRMLIGLEQGGRPLLGLVLAGQPRLVEMLAASENELLSQKLVNHLQLEPFSEEECRNYIEYRLQAAGGTGDIFSPEAISAIHNRTKGLPGAINPLCTKALEAGAALRETPLSALLVERIAHTDWRNTLAADLQQMAQEKRRSRPTRETAAETAASVAKAVKAAVSGDGKERAKTCDDSLQKEKPPAIKRTPKRKNKALLLWGLVISGLCCIVFFFYQYFSAPLPESQAVQSGLPLQRQQKPALPLVDPTHRQIAPESPAFTSSSVSVRPVEVVESKKESQKKGRIVIHSLQSIDPKE